jgi:hypothetical protein
MYGVLAGKAVTCDEINNTLYAVDPVALSIYSQPLTWSDGANSPKPINAHVILPIAPYDTPPLDLWFSDYGPGKNGKIWRINHFGSRVLPGSLLLMTESETQIIVNGVTRFTHFWTAYYDGDNNRLVVQPLLVVGPTGDVHSQNGFDGATWVPH